MIRVRRLHLCIALLLQTTCVALAQASYPEKPIRWIVGNPPGGPGDVVSRAIAQKLSERFQQQVIVDNRPGVAGQIGWATAAKAAPDGYTLTMGNATWAIHASLYSKLPYDTLKDFAPITLAPSSPLLLVANPSLVANSVKELVALAKARPGEVIYASPGSGSPHHLGMELLASMAGIKMVHVPYKGAAQVITDLIGGQVSLSIVALSASLPHVRNGKLKTFGVTSAKRSVFAPDVPTVAESGFPGYEVQFWMGVLAPAGTPNEIVNKLNGEIVSSLRSVEMRERFLSQGFEVFTSTPNEFATYIKAEVAKWAKVVKESGAKAD